MLAQLADSRLPFAAHPELVEDGGGAVPTFDRMIHLSLHRRHRANEQRPIHLGRFGPLHLRAKLGPHIKDTSWILYSVNFPFCTFTSQTTCDECNMDGTWAGAPATLLRYMVMDNDARLVVKLVQTLGKLVPTLGSTLRSRQCVVNVSPMVSAPS